MDGRGRRVSASRFMKPECSLRSLSVCSVLKPTEDIARHCARRLRRPVVRHQKSDLSSGESCLQRSWSLQEQRENSFPEPVLPCKNEGRRGGHAAAAIRFGAVLLVRPLAKGLSLSLHA